MKNCTGILCVMQYGMVDPATCSCVSTCPQATPPRTRADRIRAMTDEELADFLSFEQGQIVKKNRFKIRLCRPQEPISYA